MMVWVKLHVTNREDYLPNYCFELMVKVMQYIVAVVIELFYHHRIRQGLKI